MLFRTLHVVELAVLHFTLILVFWRICE